MESEIANAAAVDNIIVLGPVLPVLAVPVPVPVQVPVPVLPVPVPVPVEAKKKRKFSQRGAADQLDASQTASGPRKKSKLQNW